VLCNLILWFWVAIALLSLVNISLSLPTIVVLVPHASTLVSSILVFDSTFHLFAVVFAGA
jgi:hypothetical protein